MTVKNSSERIGGNFWHDAHRARPFQPAEMAFDATWHVGSYESELEFDFSRVLECSEHSGFEMAG